MLRVIVVLVMVLGFTACGSSTEVSQSRPAATDALAAPSKTQGPTQIQDHAGEGSRPTLRILSPKDGEEAGVPFPVRYDVTGFKVGEAKGHIHAFMEGIDDPHLIEIPLEEPSGVVFVGDKLLTGRRDLTFVLAQADHSPLENPEAKVTIRNLTIFGGR